MSIGMAVPVLAVHVGRIAPLGADGIPSGIDKRPVEGRLRLTRVGLQGDQQADHRHHGGLDKALHHYPAEHYADWRRAVPARATRFLPGAFGENLVTQGLREADVCVGDVFSLGDARIQVSQGRQPCHKLNLRFDWPDMVAQVLASGRAGWYYRVLQEGGIAQGDLLRRLERPHPEWPLVRVWRVLFGGVTEAAVDSTALAELAALPALSVSWRSRAGDRLAALVGDGEGLPAPSDADRDGRSSA